VRSQIPNDRRAINLDNDLQLQEVRQKSLETMSDDQLLVEAKSRSRAETDTDGRTRQRRVIANGLLSTPNGHRPRDPELEAALQQSVEIMTEEQRVEEAIKRSLTEAEAGSPRYCDSTPPFCGIPHERKQQFDGSEASYTSYWQELAQVKAESHQLSTYPRIDPDQLGGTILRNPTGLAKLLKADDVVGQPNPKDVFCAHNALRQILRDSEVAEILIAYWKANPSRVHAGTVRDIKGLILRYGEDLGYEATKRDREAERAESKRMKSEQHVQSKKKPTHEKSPPELKKEEKDKLEMELMARHGQLFDLMNRARCHHYTEMHQRIIDIAVLMVRFNPFKYEWGKHHDVGDLAADLFDIVVNHLAESELYGRRVKTALCGTELEILRCHDCGEQTACRIKKFGPVISMTSSDGASISSYFDRRVSTQDDRCAMCETCGKNTGRIIEYQIQKAPTTLFVVRNRGEWTDLGESKKDHSSLRIDSVCLRVGGLGEAGHCLRGTAKAAGYHRGPNMGSGYYQSASLDGHGNANFQDDNKVLALGIVDSCKTNKDCQKPVVLVRYDLTEEPAQSVPKPVGYSNRQ